MKALNYGLPDIPYKWKIKEGWKMFRGHYRIEPIDYVKTISKYTDIITRRRRFPNENDVKRLSKAIMDFNKEVEKINY